MASEENMPNFDPEEYSYFLNMSVAYAQYYVESLSPTINWYRILLLTLYPVTALLAVIGNLTVLAAFWVERKQLLRVHFNFFIVNLAFIDLLVGAADIPIYAVSLYSYNYWPRNVIGCTVMLFNNMALTQLSMTTVVGISIDRYWAACWSQQYRKYNSRKRTLLVIIAIWVVGIGVMLPLFVTNRVVTANPYYCDYTVTLLDGWTWTFLAVVGNHLPAAIMLVCSGLVYRQVLRSYRGSHSVHPNLTQTGETSRIWVTAHHGQQDMSLSVPTTSSSDIDQSKKTFSLSIEEEKSQIASEDNSTSTQKPENVTKVATARSAAVSNVKMTFVTKEQKIFNSLRYVILAYFLLWTPYDLLEDISLSGNTNYWYPTFVTTSWVYYMSSVANPFMYALGNEKIKVAIRRIIKAVTRH